MAFAAQIKKADAMTARKRVARARPRAVLQAKPGKLDREEFERLYKSVTSRIPKTLAILAE